MAKISEQRREVADLRNENARLRSLLRHHNIDPDAGSDEATELAAGGEAVAVEPPAATAGGTDERPATSARRRAR